MKVLVSVLCYNTCDATKAVLSKFPEERDYDVLVVNDGSTDGTRDVLKEFDFNVVEHPANRGVGGALKTAIGYGMKNHYDVITIMAGNGKDNPLEIPNLLRPILEDGFDYVQGSRFLKGGRWDNLPPARYIMIRGYALFLSVLLRARITDTLNGFRAYRLDIFNDERINIWQDWLEHYELETYLSLKVLTCGFKYCEVAVSKLYPERRRGVKYSHVRPFIGWWSIIRPIFLLYLGIKK
jgi:dolichol-phosphate mannosyltransferase